MWTSGSICDAGCSFYTWNAKSFPTELGLLRLLMVEEVKVEVCSLSALWCNPSGATAVYTTVAEILCLHCVYFQNFSLPFLFVSWKFFQLTFPFNQQIDCDENWGTDQRLDWFRVDLVWPIIDNLFDTNETNPVWWSKQIQGYSKNSRKILPLLCQEVLAGVDWTNGLGK